MGALLITESPSCLAVVGLQHLRDHLESNCQRTLSTFSPSKLTVGQIMRRPLLSPPTPIEQKAAAKVVQRLLHTSSSCASGDTSPSVVKLMTVSVNTFNMHCTHILYMYMYMYNTYDQTCARRVLSAPAFCSFFAVL